MNRFFQWLRRTSKNTRTSMRRPNKARLAVEALEDRMLMSTYWVTNENDSGGGSFRQALLDANSHTGPDTIEVSRGLVFTPHTSLPPITDAVTIESVPGPGPMPQLLGTYPRSGLVIGADNCTIRGLDIVGFYNEGIRIDGKYNTLEGNVIGIASWGNSPAYYGNGVGVLISGWGSYNRIGGTTGGTENVISGNGNGIEIYGTKNVIEGNLIGTDQSGASAQGNGYAGVEIQGAANTIGGTLAGMGNVISANGHDGVLIEGTGDFVQGNYIGTDATGSYSLGNKDNGVWISYYGDGNQVGGASNLGAPGGYPGYPIWKWHPWIFAGAGNLIAGNGNGVQIGYGSSRNQVQGNLIGTDVTGVHALGNQQNGVYITGGDSTNLSANNLIGGSTAGLGNEIVASGGNGVEIDNSSNNQVQGNWIGTDPYNNRNLGNHQNGVLLYANPAYNLSSTGNAIGGTFGYGPVPAGVGNTIAFNALDGIKVENSSHTGNNPMRGNSIYGNGGLGIDLPDRPNYTPYLVYQPAIVSASSSGVVNVVVQGPLNTPFVIDLYASAPSDSSSGHAQGRRYLGSMVVFSGWGGYGEWSFYSPTFAKGDIITATATDWYGNTTQFSTGVTAT